MLKDTKDDRLLDEFLVSVHLGTGKKPEPDPEPFCCMDASYGSPCELDCQRTYPRTHKFMESVIQLHKDLVEAKGEWLPSAKCLFHCDDLEAVLVAIKGYMGYPEKE